MKFRKRKICMALFLSASLILSFLPGCEKDYTMPEGMRVAMIATPADITDHGYNYIIYEACREFCEEKDIPFRYYRALEETTDSYLSVIDAAINDEFSVVVTNSYLTGRAIRMATEANPDVKFVAVDVEKSNFGQKDEIPENLTGWVFKEAYAGYLAGYAAVKEGYRHLGFLGGIPVAAVVRYGYGFVQGASAAADELGADVEIEYVYGNQFYGDADITAYMESWYMNKGVEVVFSCGGMIWMSVATAAKKTGGKIIGVDIDQRELIDQYTGEDTVLTSATKGLDVSIEKALRKIYDGNWDEYGGKLFELGMVERDNPEENYLQLPIDGWSMKNFTVEDYKELTARMFDGELTVSNDADTPPDVSIKVNYRGTIK